MRPRRLVRILALVLLVAALPACAEVPAVADEAPATAGEASSPRRSELWRHSLADAEGLAPAVEALAAALSAGDARAITAQCGRGRLRLQLRRLELPPTLCGPSQARVLLRDYFRGAGHAELRIGPAALDDSGERARVAFELLGGEVAPGALAQRRFVAVFRQARAATWRLEALRCP